MEYIFYRIKRIGKFKFKKEIIKIKLCDLLSIESGLPNDKFNKVNYHIPLNIFITLDIKIKKINSWQ